MKAIKIDVVKQEVYEIDLKSGLKPIYEAIGNKCQTFSVPIILDNNDAVYCDDEGLFNENIGGWTGFNSNQIIVGNSILIGGDDEGESKDVEASVEWVRKNIRFLQDEILDDYFESFR